MYVKNFFATIVLATLSSASFAGHALIQGKVGAGAAGIHTAMITNVGSRNVLVHVKTYVGTLHNDVCYTGPSEAPVSFSYGPYTRSPLYLNGDILKNNFGLGFNCGVLVISTDKQTTQDSFRLYHDGFSYTMTSPSFDEVSIN